MNSKKITMVSEKRYELEEIKNMMVEESNRRLLLSIEFRYEIQRRYDDVKTLTLVFDRYSMLIKGCVTLVISLSEHEGIQYADLVVADGKELIFDPKVEEEFLRWASDYLLEIDFKYQENC